MEQNEFIEMVRRMRNAQKEYFKTRSYDALKRSRVLEVAVDNEIADMDQNEIGLFG